MVATEPIFTGRVLDVRRDTVRMPDGGTAVREVVTHPGAVGILALDEDEADKTVVLVTQYRHPVARTLDELPAGLLDVAGEPPLAAAQRELAEEAGLAAGQWHVLLDLLTSPGSSSEAIRIYLARELRPAPAAGFVAADEEAAMTVRRVPLAEAVRGALAGQLRNAAAVAGVLAAAEGVRTGWTGLRPADAPWPDRPPIVSIQP